MVLFLDVFREKYVEHEIDLDTLDTALAFVKEPSHEKNKRASFLTPELCDSQKWTLADISLIQRILSSLHEALLRELYDAMMHCFDTKIHPIGPVMYVLENHIESNPNFSSNQEDRERFRSYVHSGLVEKAKEVYQELLHKEIPPEQEAWEFYHVIQHGKSIMKLAQRIQKRYRKNPEILGYGTEFPSVPSFPRTNRDQYQPFHDPSQCHASNVCRRCRRYDRKNHSTS
jgi:pentatricopeptide repeat protein